MFKTLPGFREFPPEECSRRNFFFSHWRGVARRYRFQEFDGPVLEPLDLYREKSGAEIQEQLFHFTDKGGREVALRPEMTPTLARMVGARLGSLRKPVRWFSIGEQFRYERYQKGRKRSFYQLNADIIGEEGPAAELELIALLIDLLEAFGLGAEDFAVRLSDRTLWMLFLSGLGLSGEESLQVLAVVDKLGREPEEVLEQKLQPFFGAEALEVLGKIIGFSQLTSLKDVRQFLEKQGIAETAYEERMAAWEELWQGIQAMGLGDYVQIDLGIVRGLAYYTGFVFEAFDRAKSHRALAGGGRYDHLLGVLSKKGAPAAGFGMGDVVLQDMLEEKHKLPRWIEKTDVYVVAITPEEQAVALSAVRALRLAGFITDYALRKVAPKKQFKAADEAGASVVVIIGPEEKSRGEVKLKHLGRGEEVTVENGAMIPRLEELLAGG